MATSNVKYTPYEIGLKIKSPLGEGADAKVILETTGLKRAQLTTYKRIIKNGRLEDLRSNPVRQILADLKKLEQFKNLKKPKQSENLNADASVGGEQSLGDKMINEIEKSGQNEKDDINLEYFVGGQRKFYVPHHSHHSLADNQSIEILLAQNMLLRMRLRNEMGKRIEELEMSEIILKAKNERLENHVKELEERLRKCSCK